MGELYVNYNFLPRVLSRDVEYYFNYLGEKSMFFDETKTAE
jgi:hypothetical protein